jgi:protein-S-isoprenylcysteine O-methyltransferase Ste14
MSKLGGSILSVVGTLIAGTSGLCCAVMFSMTGEVTSDGLALIGVIGGIPFLVGMLMLVLGVRELRRSMHDDQTRGPPGDMSRFD